MHSSASIPNEPNRSNELNNNNSNSTSQPQRVIGLNNRPTSKFQYDTSRKFIPSPELIVDSSQSSESNENFIINNQPFVIPVSKNCHDQKTKMQN